MTDKELIKVLENELENAYEKAIQVLKIIDKHISRQRAEIDSLEDKLLGVMHSVDKWRDDEELKRDAVNRAAIMREKTLKITENQQAEIEKLTIENQSLRMAANSYKSHYNEAKSEAVKEFAERLKKECIIDRGYEILQEGTIDNLVKEMAGDTE